MVKMSHQAQTRYTKIYHLPIRPALAEMDGQKAQRESWSFEKLQLL